LETNVGVRQELVKVKLAPIMISLMLAGFVGTFNETALNIALSNFIEVFSITESTVQWLTTGYLLTLGILMPVSGLLMQWFTTRQLFMTAVVVSLIGAVVGATAGSFEILLTARVLQAVGTGLLLPLMFNTVLTIFPAHKRGMAMGLITMIFTAAPAVGPAVSGLLIATLDWRWIFWLSFVLMVIALIIGSLFMQNVSTVTKPRIDISSVLFSTVGFGGIVFGLSYAGDAGWGSSKVVLALAFGGIALVCFVIRQLRMDRPVMNLRAFKHRMFLVGTVIIFVCMMVNLMAVLLLPMFLIRVMEMSTLSAAIALLPGGILFGVLSPVIGRLFDRFGPRVLVIPGLFLAAAAVWFFTNLTVASTIVFITTVHMCLMLGLLLAWMPAQTNGLNQLPKDMHHDGTAIVNTLCQIAGAVGVAMAVTLMTSGAGKHMEKIEGDGTLPFTNEVLTLGIQNAFGLALFVAAAGAILSLFVTRVKVQR